MRIQKTSIKCFELAEISEGCFLKAYQCPAKVWTIGIGCTYYEDGTRVKEGDVITRERAVKLYLNVLEPIEKFVDSVTVDTITQGQFDANVDFAFNCGSPEYKMSSLLKKVNANPNDPTIANSFRQWVYGGDGSHNKVDDDGDGLVDEAGEKQKLKGLVTRNERRIMLYYTGTFK